MANRRGWTAALGGAAIAVGVCALAVAATAASGYAQDETPDEATAASGLWEATPKAPAQPPSQPAQPRATVRVEEPVEAPEEQRSLPIFDFRTSPIGLMFGVANANLDVALHRAFTLGAAFGYFTGSTTSTRSTYYEYGLVGTMYLSGQRHVNGPYLRFGVYLIPITATRTSGGTAFSGTTANYAEGVSGGYEWIWGGHFNIQLGLGVSYYGYTRSIAGSSDVGTTLTFNEAVAGGLQPVLEASVGYAF